VTETTVTFAPQCPECRGQLIAGHPDGRLAIKHDIRCSLSAAEDATAAVDQDRAMGRPSIRPATAAERVLLRAIGMPVDQEEPLDTVVEFVAPGVRRRTWPKLEGRPV
jgi:hypothetical protein